MALPLALGILLSITISVTMAIQYASAGSRTASLNASEQNARAIAEDGFNRAAALIAASPNSSTPVYGSAADYPQGGSAVWTGTRSGDVWSVASTATVPNPTGPGSSPLTHRVQAQLDVTHNPGAWNFVYVKPIPGTCLLFKNAFRMDAPLYVDGNLCLANEATYQGPRLYVKGTVQTDNLASIGTLTSPVPAVSVKNNAPAASGCRYTTALVFLLPCTALQRVFTASFNTTVPDITKPPVDLATRYADAAPGDTTRGHSCTSSNLGKVSSKFTSNRMDDNTSRDSSVGTVDLLPDVSWSCTQKRADGSVLGSVSWTYGMPGTLTVSGTFFVDGDIVPSQNRHAVVNGEGTIYANNRIVIGNDTRICGVADCGHSWSPNMEPPHTLFFVAGYSGHPAIELKSYGAKFQGGLYAVGGVKVQNGASMHGPVIADQLEAENSADFDPWPWFTDLPDGAPSSGGTTVSLKPGTWRG
jgi:hypothetical protein